MHPDKRTKTVEECDAISMLLGDRWSYGIASHAFFREPYYSGRMEWRCAETWQQLDERQRDERRREYRHWKWEHEDV